TNPLPQGAGRRFCPPSICYKECKLIHCRNLILLLTLSVATPLFAQSPPTLIFVTANGGVPFAQGTVVQVSLAGSNFASPATVAVNNSGVAVSNVVVLNTAKMQATFTIAADAPIGSANVTVTTPSGTTGPVSISIVPPPATLSTINP